MGGGGGVWVVSGVLQVGMGAGAQWGVGLLLAGGWWPLPRHTPPLATATTTTWHVAAPSPSSSSPPSLLPSRFSLLGPRPAAQPSDAAQAQRPAAAQGTRWTAGRAADEVKGAGAALALGNYKPGGGGARTEYGVQSTE
jgi:hypothetical protein